MMTGVFVYAQSNGEATRALSDEFIGEYPGVPYLLYAYCLRITTIVSILTRYGQLLESRSLTWSSLCGARVHDSPIPFGADW